MSTLFVIFFYVQIVYIERINNDGVYVGLFTGLSPAFVDISMKLDTLEEINRYLDELHKWILEVKLKHDIE